MEGRGEGWKGDHAMNRWNKVEIERQVKEMAGIYKRKRHRLGQFKEARSGRGLRYTAECQRCGRELKFEIVMGQVEPTAVAAGTIYYCVRKPPARAKKGRA